MSTSIYLYLKTHNITGKKYLGMTISDPYKYPGSGTYWRNHLRAHTNNVSTEVLFESTDPEEFSATALKYSMELNVVEDPQFANLMHEYGLNGGPNAGSFKPGRKGVPLTPEVKAILSANKTAYWVEWHKHNTLKPKEEYVKIGYNHCSRNTAVINKVTLKCPHCNKSGNMGNMKRWHFDNCKAIGGRTQELRALNTTIIKCPHCNESGNMGNMKRWHFDNCKAI